LEVEPLEAEARLSWLLGELVRRHAYADLVIRIMRVR
jgi:hypothetical protein